MSDPAVFTIPLHRPFADALAAGLLVRARGDRLALARTLLILPNNRAQRAITDAFVRRADGGLLLPRLVSIGDPDLGDRIGAAFDPAEAEPIPPAIDPIARRMILARLLGEADRRLDAAEAVRLADDLARTLDQLTVEDIAPSDLAEAVPDMLSGHWQVSLDILKVVLEAWPRELEQRGRIDLADRRNRLLVAAERRWAETPPDGPVIAAGINVAAPAAANLLRRIARLPQGLVVLAGLDQAMPDAEWDALDALETHPQHALKRLLDRMGVARGEVRRWRSAGNTATDVSRGRAIGAAMTPAAFTDKWRDLPPRQRRLTGVEAIELANPAAEAQAIAIAMRQAIEMPGRTVALVTNDRGLAARVAANLKRWGIDADDSAGRNLSLTPPGTLLLGIADLIAERFAPVPLLALLKHPLVAAGEGRAAWLDGVRKLDRALRGPRPASGLAGIDHHLAGGEERSRRERLPAQAWWAEARARLDAIVLPASGRIALRDALAAVRATASALAGDEAWTRPAGRAAADLFEGVEAAADEGPADVGIDALPALLRALLDGVAVRPPQGGHPRVFIWGLIEARLQQADLMILGGLNEGVWPSLPAPDPWLAPAIRAELKLPGLDRRIGSEAEQFAAALGSPRVLLTRARRDARSPTVASRFWLRLDAMAGDAKGGGIARPRALPRWAEAIDRPEDHAPADKPRPRPPVADRPRKIAVTKLDRLQADPFAFYADAMLKLRSWDGVDADPTPAWRGNAVHAVLDKWLKEDRLDPDLLRGRAETLLNEAGAHPVLRALWAPRLLEAIDWIGAQVAEDRAKGRTPIAAERKGVVEFAGITLEGIVDRIDALPGGGIAVIDYKTGKPPSKKAVVGGFTMQLGLLGLIAELGGFGDDLRKPAQEFEYWSLSSKDGALGFRQSPVGLDKQGQGIDPADFTARAGRVLEGAVLRWLTGDDEFVAKLHPELAPYGDYDQLMRLDEWYGRGKSDG